MFRRFYHISCVTYNLRKQGLRLNKMLNPKSKKQWFPSQVLSAEPLPSVKSLTKTQNEPGKQGSRRIAMLNKMFMKHITDLMSTGTVSMDIVGRGIEISKVRVTRDMQTVNVFWVCKGTSRDEETESVLSKIAGALRHELSTLRVMGEVPYVVFVKDKHEARLVELDRRLALADYGEEYAPTEIGHLLKSEFTLDTKLSPEMKAKIKKLEDVTGITDDPLPEMTNNVFGLDHDKIMKRLVASRRRSKEAWSSLDSNSPVVSYRTEESKPSDDVDVRKQKQELADFLLKRQILQNKLQKELRDARKQCQVSEEDDQDNIEEYYEDRDSEEKIHEQLFEEEYYNDSDKFHIKR